MQGKNKSLVQNSITGKLHWCKPAMLLELSRPEHRKCKKRNSNCISLFCTGLYHLRKHNAEIRRSAEKFPNVFITQKGNVDPEIQRKDEFGGVHQAELDVQLVLIWLHYVDPSWKPELSWNKNDVSCNLTHRPCLC